MKKHLNVRPGFLAIVGILLILFFGVYRNMITAQQPYSMPSTPQVPLYVNYAKFDHLYGKSNFINNAASTTFTANQSGSVVIVTVGTPSITETLPAPVAGMTYDFYLATSTASGNTFKVITNAGTVFIAGLVTITGTGSGTTFACNGTSHVATTANATTTGGLIGSWYRFTALTATLWNVTGMSAGSGSLVTPCSTS